METIRPGGTIEDAADQLRWKQIGVLVINANGTAVDGILSEHDIVTGLAHYSASLLDQRVDFHMTKDVKTCSMKDSVNSVMELMTDRRIRHMLVIQGGLLAGIVSIGDAIKNQLH